MSDADRAKWNARYRESCPYAREDPSAFLVSLADRLPRSGRALDLAGGAGRNAIWLAQRGLDVTLADISDEALALARAGAERAGVTIELVPCDLERDLPPAGPFDLILSFNFLRRELFARFSDLLAPGGRLIYLQPTRSNLLRHPRPPAAFLLEDGELAGLLRGLDMVLYEEGWFGGEDGEPRHEARLVALKAV